MPSSFPWPHSLRIILAMGWSDFILKYRGSVLGFLWSFIVPLTKFIVIFYVFRPFMSDVPQYHLYLFLGLLLWEHFAMTTSACIGMLQDKAAIIQKVAFPRLLLILAVGWQHVIILVTYIIIYLIMATMLGSLSITGLLYLPFLLLQATLLALGIGMFLSAFSLRFRDIPHLWAVVLQVLFWLTPVIYSLSIIDNVTHPLWKFLHLFIHVQPLSILLTDARQAMLSADVPDAVHASLFTVFCLILFSVGSWIFQRRSRYFIQEY